MGRFVKIAVIVVLLAAGTGVRATDNSKLIIGPTECYLDLYYADANHMVYTSTESGHFSVMDYNFATGKAETLVTSTKENGIGLSVSSAWNQSIANNYVCWLLYETDSKHSKVGYAKSNSDKKGVCTSVKSVRVDATVDNLGNVYWSEKSDGTLESLKTAGVFSFNIDKDSAPRKIFAATRNPFVGAYVSAYNGYAAWMHPVNGKYDIMLYDAKTDKVTDVTKDFNETVGMPVIIGDYVYWQGRYKIVQYSIKNNTIETVWDIDIKDISWFDINRSPESDYLVISGFTQDTHDLNAKRNYFIVTYNPKTKELKKQFLGDKAIQIGNYGSYGNRIAFSSMSDDAVDQNIIKIYYPETRKIETVIDNSQLFCATRVAPKLVGNTLTWLESDYDPYRREKCSSIYSLVLENR